jgi:hypothetical protein
LVNTFIVLAKYVVTLRENVHFAAVRTMHFAEFVLALFVCTDNRLTDDIVRLEENIHILTLVAIHEVK